MALRRLVLGRSKLLGRIWRTVASAAIWMPWTSLSPNVRRSSDDFGFSSTATAPAMVASAALGEPFGVSELSTTTGIGLRSMMSFRKVRPLMRGRSRSSVSTSTGR